MVPVKKTTSPFKKSKKANKPKGKSMNKKKSCISLSPKTQIRFRKIQPAPKVGTITRQDARRAARIVLGKSKKK